MRLKKILQLALCLSFAMTKLSAGIYAAPAVVTVTIHPASITLAIKGNQQFTAQVSGAKNKSVVWTVNDTPNGNSTVGAINSAGRYTAPATPPSGFAVTIKATSVASQTAVGVSEVTIRNQIPRINSVTPSTLPLGPFTITVNGSRYVSGAKLLWNNTPLQTAFVSSTRLTATGNATQTGSVQITVANPGPEAVSTPVTVSVVSNINVSVTPNAVSLAPSATQQFQATVSGAANMAVTWKVNGTAGGNASTGTVTQSGLYTAPSAAPAGAITVSAVSQADNSTQGAATVMIVIQDTQSVTYGRFLDQTTFGPTSQSMSHIRQIGLQPFLDEQFATPESQWPPVNSASVGDAETAFFMNAMNGQDQLRQRVIFALSEIFVIASNKNVNGNEIVPWLQLLSRNAFGNYRTLLREITLDATMGKYLDLANSAKPGIAGGANENYPREVMQLFSIGLWKLNQDGSQQLDGQGNPIPAYDQNDVRQLALALTGWTFNTASGTPPTHENPNYFPGPMTQIATYHDRTQKTMLGQTLAANQTHVQDLDSAIDVLFNHPNVGPFVATRLIRALVTSNPSPAYISRVAAVFNNNGQSVRGDMKSALRAILMDEEARNDTPPANFGRLRTPVQHTIAFLRALNIPSGSPSQFAYIYYSMGEPILDAPSVFGHYSPVYRVPKTALFGPEFQIYSPSEAVNRANFIYSWMTSTYPINPALQPFINVAGNPATLINAADTALFYGRMSPQMRTALMNALPAMTDNYQRVFTVLYLTATSSDYLVQH